MTTTIGPALGHGPWTQQGVGTTPGYDAIDFRRSVAGFDRGEGASTYGSFRVSQRAAGATMTVDVNMDDGAFVRGDAVTLQGLYYVPPHSATINEAITAAHATLPRIDQVVLEVKDHQHDASGSNLAQVRVVDGTATGGATLDNRTGAAALPSSALLLADVLVAAADTSITNAEIRDRRAFIAAGIPPAITALDMVAFTSPLAARSPDTANDAAHASHDLRQAAAVVYLPRRIAGATRIRWAYIHAATAITGNYVLSIHDASTRKIIDTGSVAFTGAANTRQARSETISATTLEPGWYFAFIGVDSGAGSCGYVGWETESLRGGLSRLAVPFANAALASATGGLTVPSTLLAFTDTSASDILAPKVPQFALSVG